MSRTTNYFLLVFILIVPSLFSQTDSLVFKNGNYMVGEIKGLNRGVLSIETDYSDDDFTIEWDGIKEIYSTSYFLFTTSEGKRINGSLNSTGDGKILIVGEEETITISPDELVYMNSVDQDFWSKMSAQIDIGYDYTKAKNNQQFSVRSYVGYLTDRWMADASVNSIITSQDSVETIRRTDGNIGFTYFLPHSWFVMAQGIFLSNTEQQLDLRSTGKLGIGNYIIQSNHSYWGISAGAALTNEVYTYDGTKTSGEAFVGTELNLFDIGDLSLLTNAVVYPSLTESGRVRFDFKFDLKYDLPYDFYVRLGTTANYDNKSVGSQMDYVLQTAFGWEL